MNWQKLNPFSIFDLRGVKGYRLVYRIGLYAILAFALLGGSFWSAIYLLIAWFAVTLFAVLIGETWKTK